MRCVNLSLAAPLSAAAVVSYRTIPFCLPVVPCHRSALVQLCSAPLPTVLPFAPAPPCCGVPSWLFLSKFCAGCLCCKDVFWAQSDALARPARCPPSCVVLPCCATKRVALNVPSEAAEEGADPAQSDGQEDEDGRAWPQRWCELPGWGKWVPLGFGAGGRSMVL